MFLLQADSLHSRKDDVPKGSDKAEASKNLPDSMPLTAVFSNSENTFMHLMDANRRKCDQQLSLFMWSIVIPAILGSIFLTASQNTAPVESPSPRTQNVFHASSTLQWKLRTWSVTRSFEF